MILLIFAVLSLTLISLWLASALNDVNKLLKEEREISEARRGWADSYWQYYCEACSDKRDLKRELEELKGLYEGKTILAESLDKRVDELLDELIDALHEAESFRELANERSDEIEKQNQQIKSLKNELENEFDWSMRYSESVDKYARLYDESLKESARLEGELEQTQETLNMLEYGYELLQHKSEQWKKDLKYYREKYEGNYDPIE